MEVLLQLIIMLSNAMSLVLFVYVIMSWVLPPYHQARQALARFIEPLLAPIRQMLPQTGMFDFSIIVLFILLFILESVARQTLLAL
jgi:YggT family protein